MLPQNISYSPYLKKMSDVAIGVGKALGPRKKPSKAVDVSRFGGVTDIIKSGTPKRIPMSAKNVGTITTKYGGSTRFEKVHPGIDYTRGIGSPVGSWVAGKVSKVITGKGKEDKGFGNYVIVTDKDGNKHRYSHLQSGYVPLSVGQQVQRGTVLGLEGTSGSTYSLHGGTGAHVDLRIRDLYGKYVDPHRFIY